MSEDTTRRPLIPPDDLLKQLIRESVGEAQQALTQKFDELNQRFERLDEKVDRRLQDTRPIWEEVRSRLERVESKLDQLDIRVERLESKFDLFIKDLFELRVDQDRLKDRISRLEQPSV